MTMHDPTDKYQGEISPGAMRVAKAVSFVTQPTILSIPTFILLCLSIQNTMDCLMTMAVCLVTAVVLPIINVHYYSVKFNNDDGDIYRREDRFMPLLIGTVCYAVGVVALWLIDAPWLITVLMICYALCTFSIMLISTRWKISIHATGIMGPSIALGVAYPPYGFLYMLLLPAIAVCRYYQKKHTPAQIIGGALFGGILTTLVFLLML